MYFSIYLLRLFMGNIQINLDFYVCVLCMCVVIGKQSLINKAYLSCINYYHVNPTLCLFTFLSKAGCPLANLFAQSNFLHIIKI